MKTLYFRPMPLPPCPEVSRAHISRQLIYKGIFLSEQTGTVDASAKVSTEEATYRSPS